MSPQVNLSTASIVSFAEKSNSKSYEPDQAQRAASHQKVLHQKEPKQKTKQPPSLYGPILASEFSYRADFELIARTECASTRWKALQKPDAERARDIRATESLSNRLLGYRLCGLFTKYQECTSCYQGDLSSASYLSGGNAKFCHLRNCTFCGRRAGGKKSENLGGLYRNLPKREGYRLRAITVQIAWQPWLYEEVTIDAFRNRARKGWEAIRAAWDPARYLELPKGHSLLEHALRQEGSALYAKLESSQGGFLHFHMLHYGPFQRWYCTKPECKERCSCQRRGEKPEQRYFLEDLLKMAFPQIGRVWVAEVKTGEEEKAVREVCKYVSKGPSPLDEKAILGAKRWRLNPLIAVRLELALFGLHCNEVYGGFRKTPQRKVTEEELAELSSGVEGIAENLFGKNFPSHEDFLEWAESVPTLGEVWTDTTEEEERMLTVALAELLEAHGPGSRDSLVAFLAELLHQLDQAEDWLDPDRACPGCGVCGGWEWKTVTTFDWVKYKQARKKPNIS